MSDSKHDLRVYHDIIDLVASPENPTPMVRLNERANPNQDFEIYVKLERYNPFGSIKDRIALSMINGTEIGEGQTIIEPSSGNTGIALAGIANARNIPVEIAVPERIPEEKKTVLRMLGINVLWEADDALCPQYPNEGARGLVAGMVKSEGSENYVSPNQYENQLNVEAHLRTTGPEIWRQTQGKIDTFFAGFGTCGTLTGIGTYLKQQNPEVKVIGIEPATSNHKLPGMKRITGLSEELIPKILDMSVVDEVVQVEDDDAYKTALMIAKTTGLLVGPTTGSIAFAALEHAKTHKGLGVVISPDDAFKYVSFFAPYVKDVGNPEF
jgi:cysteine synthase A/cysteine synthase B